MSRERSCTVGVVGGSGISAGESRLSTSNTAWLLGVCATRYADHGARLERRDGGEGRAELGPGLFTRIEEAPDRDFRAADGTFRSYAHPIAARRDVRLPEAASNCLASQAAIPLMKWPRSRLVIGVRARPVLALADLDSGRQLTLRRGVRRSA